MQKIKLSITILLLALFLVGCDKPADTGDTMPADVFCGCYDTYEELEIALTSSDGEAVIAAADVELYGEIYKQFVAEMMKGTLRVVRPYWGNEEISLEDEWEYGQLFLDSKSELERPKIWYHFGLDGERCIMTIVYLSDDEQEYAKTHTLLETITYISPERGKNLKNWWWDFSVKKQTTESWQLFDREVETISSEYRDDTKKYKRFIYDNMYVILWAEPEVFEEDIWSQFHLK